MKKKNEEGEKRDEVRFSSGSASAEVERQWRRKRSNKKKTRKSWTQERFGPYLSMRAPAAFKFMHGDKYFKIIPSVSSVLHFSVCSLVPSWRDRKEDDSLSRERHDNNAPGKIPERTIEREREKEKETDCARTRRGNKAKPGAEIYSKI